MKEIKELIEKILIQLVKRKIRNYLIYGCGMFLFEFFVLIAVFLVAIWGLNTLFKGLSNPEGIIKATTEQAFKKAMEKPEPKETNTKKDIKQKAQHKENSEEKERRIEEEIKAREEASKEIKCIGNGCGKPKRGIIEIKESK